MTIATSDAPQIIQFLRIVRSSLSFFLLRSSSSLFGIKITPAVLYCNTAGGKSQVMRYYFAILSFIFSRSRGSGCSSALFIAEIILSSAPL